MPFDALVTPEQQKSLREILAGQGIEPVSLETLAAYKRAQLARFGPSFWYCHQAMLPTALLGSVAGMAVNVGLAQQIDPGSSWCCALILGWMCIIAVLIGVGAVRLRAGSHWEERWAPIGWLDDLGVPKRIANVARAACRETPGSALIVGELIQERVVLDPYLLLERAGELVCLGIWDDRQIIACALSRDQADA